MKKRCKSCKSEIDAKATKCSKCGTDQRNWFMRHKIITGILVIIVVFGVIGSLGGSKSGTKSDSASTSQSTEAKPTPIVMDATALVGEYDNNKLAAQDKYTGKVVQTTGFIQNISSDITGSYYLSLKPSNEQYYAGTTLQCFFKDKSALTALSNGQQITVQGTMQDMSLGIVEMKDCSEVK